MKNKFLVMLVMFFCLPLFVDAKQLINLPKNNVSLSVPDDWLIFTRENIYNNSDLKNLNITEQYMEDFFNNNDAYIDALPKSILEDGGSVEFFLQIKDVEGGVHNISNYSDKGLEDALEEFGSLYFTVAKLYESPNGYKFMYVDTRDFSTNYNIIHYYTVINKKGYNFKIQYPIQNCIQYYSGDKEMYNKCRDLDSIYRKQKDVMVEIIDSVSFDEKLGIGSLWEAYSFYIIIGIVALVVIIIIVSGSKKKNGNSNSGINTNVATYDTNPYEVNNDNDNTTMNTQTNYNNKFNNQNNYNNNFVNSNSNFNNQNNYNNNFNNQNNNKSNPFDVEPIKQSNNTQSLNGTFNNNNYNTSNQNINPFDNINIQSNNNTDNNSSNS